jgi:fatty-acyl-CoA synthase
MTEGEQMSETVVLTESYAPADTTPELSDHTVCSLLAERAGEYPDRLALVGTGHDGAEVRLTYAELYDEAQRVATAIRGLAEPGDPVAMWAPNYTEWVLIQHGAALAGVVLVALNPVLRLPELEYALDHSRARVLIHAERSRDYDLAAVAAQAAQVRPGLRLVSLSDRTDWRAEEVDPAVVAAAPTDPDLPVMLQYTSGTTGSPKGVLLRHRSLVNVARFTMEYVDMPAGAVTVNPLPMFHTAACVIGTLGPLWIAGTEVLIEQFAPGPVLDTMRREQASVLFFVPAVLGALLEAQRGSDQPAPRLDVALGGAAPVPDVMIEAAEQVFGANVVNVFGQTELAPVLTATRPGDSRRDKLTTVGHPLPQVDTKIVDPATGKVQLLGEVGEICARGYQQLIEYLHDPAATSATVDADGFVHTGDLGAMDERGYITLAGRLKELIIRGGENIAPAEIEICLAAHPSVAESAVFGLPDRRMGEVVAAVVRVREEADDLAASLVAHCRERLSPYKVPTRWFVSAELPVTPTGKVQKFRLVDLVGTAAVREITPPG